MVRVGMAEAVSLFEGSDACVTPVLSLEESFEDLHMRARETYAESGGFWRASAAAGS